MTGVIFVAGVHGIGKGTLCKKIETAFGFTHFSSSSLIKSVKNADVDTKKVVIDADKNQDLLLTALERLTVDSDYILLDGHFCLQSDIGIFDVPLKTFKGMELVATLLLVDDVSAIYQRLNLRDAKALDETVIGELQAREQERAYSIAKALNIPLMESNIYDFDSIKTWLTNLT